MKLLKIIIIIILSHGVVHAQRSNSLSGRVVDNSSSANPVAFATVWFNNSNVSLVTNGEGDFTIKIPAAADTLWIKQLGYQALGVPLMGLDVSGRLTFKLSEIPLSIESVLVRSEDPNVLLRNALKSVPRNYPDQAMNLVGFYRESIKKNNQYVSVVEAIPDIYKPSVTSLAEDQIRLYKGRRSYDFSKVDTLMMRYRGGLNTALMLDVAKFHEIVFVDPDSLSYFYNLSMGVPTDIQGRQQYVINFQQKLPLEPLLFRGTIYIDRQSMAISRCEYSMNVEGVASAIRHFIVRQPPKYNIEILEALYVADYLLDQSTWMFNYSKAQVRFKIRSDRRRFNADYTISSELAITDRSSEGVSKFPTKERLKSSEMVFDRVIDYSDPEFWENYNYIEPEQPLETAVKRLNRKLKVKN